MNAVLNLISVGHYCCWVTILNMALLNHFTGLTFADLQFQKAGGMAAGRASHYVLGRMALHAMLNAQILGKHDSEAVWRRVGVVIITQPT